MTFLYKELHSLPAPPAIMVNGVIDRWIELYNTFMKISDYPNLELKFDRNLSQPRPQHVSTYDNVRGEILDWLKTNVFVSDRGFSHWITRMYYRHSTMFDLNQPLVLYEKHLDSRTIDPTLEQNHYALIYNITNSIGDLIFHQEYGKPLVRNDRPIYIPPSSGINQSPHKKIDFSNTNEIFRVSPPPKTWYLARLDVIHSVENCNHVPRLAFQLRLSEREVLKSFNKY